MKSQENKPGTNKHTGTKHVRKTSQEQARKQTPGQHMSGNTTERTDMNKDRNKHRTKIGEANTRNNNMNTSQEK